jgi:hypothetical protein
MARKSCCYSLLKDPVYTVMPEPLVIKQPLPAKIFAEPISTPVKETRNPSVDVAVQTKVKKTVNKAIDATVKIAANKDVKRPTVATKGCGETPVLEDIILKDKPRIAKATEPVICSRTTTPKPVKLPDLSALLLNVKDFTTVEVQTDEDV